MPIFYYYLEYIPTGEKKWSPFENYLGEPGDKIWLTDGAYIIEDYAVEEEVLDEPEDY